MPKKSKDVPPREFYEELVRRLDEDNAKRHKAYLDFLQSIASLDGDARAHELIKYWTKDQSVFGDAEALVYLCSREPVDSASIDKLAQMWKSAEVEVLKRANAPDTVTRIDGDKTRVTKRRRTKVLSAKDIATASTFELPDFWESSHAAEWHIDATMLRAVEWCDIGGFDSWWKRMARSAFESVVQGGVDLGRAAFYLFAYCRSPLARTLLAKALNRILDALEISRTNGHQPWDDLLTDRRRRPVFSADVAHASTVVFASVLLNRAHSSEVFETAVDVIQRAQREDGGWPYWEIDDRSFPLPTAMAMHALALSNAPGRERALRRGAAWLRAQQTREGYWEERGIDLVFLTVLVMDALELASGGTRTTMNVGLAGTLHASGAVAAPKRFAVALTFPGVLRHRVEAIASLLAAKLGRGRILYDRYHTAEFARPDLDTHLQRLYHDESELVVPFLCADYATKEWPGLEWRAVRDLLKKRKVEAIMFLRSDDTEVPGVFSIDGYVDLRQYTDAEVADLILKRYASVPR